MPLVSIVGIIASACTAVSLLPQLVKTVKEKDASNTSIGMMVVLFAGLGSWIYYGILKEDWIIIISNVVSFTINLVLGFFTIKYRNKSPRKS